MRVEVRAGKNFPFQRGVILYAEDRSNPHKRISATEVSFKETPEGGMLVPLLSLDDEKAQLLMDSLWECGLRPSEGSGSAGSLAATQRHLEDMRKLAFSVLRIK